MGRYQEALDHAEAFRQLDPVAPTTHVATAAIHLAAVDYERAIAASRDALELESQSEPAQYFLAMAHHFAGHTDMAIARLTPASRECPALLSGLAFVLAQSGREEEARRVIEEMKERATTQEELSPYDFAEAFIGLGDVERALGYLSRGCELRLSEIVGVAVDPVFRSLHGDPRFQRILRTVGLDDGASDSEHSRSFSR